MTWNGIFTAPELTVDSTFNCLGNLFINNNYFCSLLLIIVCLGSSTVDGSSLVKGQFTTQGPASFGSTIDVTTSATIGTSITVTQNVHHYYYHYYYCFIYN